MNRKNRIKFIIVFALTLFVIWLSSVIAFNNTDEKDSEFFSTNKTQISNGETLEMILDISKVDYDNFDFKLTSKNLDTSNITVSEDVELENLDNEITISIDKSKVKINKIVFDYQIPEDLKIGSQIELNAQILVEKENSDENNVLENTEIESEIVNNTLIENEKETVLNQTIKVEIVEKKSSEENENSNDINKQENKFPSNNIENNNQNSNDDKTNFSFDEKDDSKSNSSNFSNKESFSTSNNQSSQMNSSSFSGGSVATTQETAVYNGSNDNYLLNLEVEGETLNTTFNKENTTYFIETDSKTEVTVNYELEDDSAVAQITGNTNLKTGVNKILISVTAENGDVRYYRIFVTIK